MTGVGSADRAPLAEPVVPLSRLRGLQPGWFGAVMGTAIVAVAAFDNPGNVDSLQRGMHAVGGVFAVLAYLLALGYACYGTGLVLFLLVMGLLHDRLVLHPLPAAALAPSLWIGLGPLGGYAVATLTLARTWHTGAPEAIGAGLFALLALAWLIVAVRTRRGVLTGLVWQR